MTPPQQRLLVIVAHPDDETFGIGSVIAGAAAAGVEVTVICATRGEAGEAPAGFAGDLGVLREGELRAAGAELGVERFFVLDFGDSGMAGDPAPGTLAAASEADVVAALNPVIDAVAPQVVVTLDPDFGDGHRDHVAIARATVTACLPRPGVRVYAWTVTRPLMARWFAELERVRPDSEHLDLDQAGLGRPDDHITTVLESSALAGTRMRAVALHASQTAPYEGMPIELRDDFLNTDRLVRLVPEWTGGPVETALFEPRPS
jgi:LmbE family N-acetylglucosaminyl deacetylase